MRARERERESVCMWTREGLSMNRPVQLMLLASEVIQGANWKGAEPQSKRE
jgi:hypothetical protein